MATGLEEPANVSVVAVPMSPATSVLVRRKDKPVVESPPAVVRSVHPAGVVSALVVFEVFTVRTATSPGCAAAGIVIERLEAVPVAALPACADVR